MRGIVMKKYVKPELFFERYELNQHIASCGFDLNLPSEKVCGFIGDKEAGLDYVIYTVKGICDNTDIEGYCYQADGADGFNTFNS